jgi:DnaJ-class molecular chaperone
MESRKTKIISVVAIVALALTVITATYAYFNAQGGSATSTNLNVTTYTTDVFTFAAGDEINLEITQSNFESGKGNAARRGGVNGDLIILIEEIEHPELVRDGNDLLYNTFIGFPEAVLGDSVEIPTLEGKVKVKIEPGTQPGKILRLKGKGIPDINGYGKGDLLVKVNVWIPKNLSKEDKKTMEDLKERSFLKPSNVENKKGFFRKVKDFFE